jgi:hypothetical protein
MICCKHLRALEHAIQRQGIRETYRGRAWSDNCREWVYFDCFIDTAAVRAKFAFKACVKDHIHRGTHDGSERGFYCEECHDGVMGLFEPGPGTTVFRG